MAQSMPAGSLQAVGLEQRLSTGAVDSVPGVFRLLRRRWLVVVLSAVVFALGGLAFSLAQTPEYEATATLYVTSGTDDNSQAAYQGSLASQQRVESYTKLVQSDAVVRQAIAASGLQTSIEDAKTALRSTATSGTVLLTISAVDASRDDASRLANAVSQAMTAYVSRLETPSGGGQPLAKLTLVTPATAGDKPVTPKTSRNIALMLIVGFLVGVFAVLARARWSNKLRDENDVLSVTKGPVLAVIPRDEVLKRRGLIDFSEGASPAAEAFRKLRTNLTFTNVDNPPRTMVVTSAVAVEGKTTTAMNLAASLAEAGSKVVLVDADLRRPQVNARTGLMGEIGFTNFLRGDGDLNDLVQPTHAGGLWVLASGPKPPNPAELLGTQRTVQALTDLSESFDYVIVDSPPILPVTDAVVLAQAVDGVLLVGRSGSTKVGDLKDAYEQVSATHTPVIGLVLTEVPSDKSRYGYYAVKPKQRRAIFGRSREPKVIEQVLEPKRTGRH